MRVPRGVGRPGSGTEPALLFSEVQRLAGLWLWLLLGAVAAGTIVIFGIGMVQQLILGKPWGNRPMPDAALMAIGSVMMLIGAGLPVLLGTARLVTEVRSDGLYVRYIPFHLRFKRISLDGVEHCEARQYRPIREYGGWGIRCGWKGCAYNVKGNWGVRIDYTKGRHILIGSQQSEELAEAIRSLLPPRKTM